MMVCASTECADRMWPHLCADACSRLSAAEGRARVVAACIRKLFTIFNALLKHGEQWNPDHFAIPLSGPCRHTRLRLGGRGQWAHFLLRVAREAVGGTY